MDRSEILQIKLPRAMDLGNTLVGSREFPLTLFARQENYYVKAHVTGIRVIPHFAPVQVYLYKGDVEMGRYASHNGRLDFEITVTSEEPVTLKLYNLSIDTEVMLTVETKGELYNAVQRR